MGKHLSTHRRVSVEFNRLGLEYYSKSFIVGFNMFKQYVWPVTDQEAGGKRSRKDQHLHVTS